MLYYLRLSAEEAYHFFFINCVIIIFLSLPSALIAAVIYFCKSYFPNRILTLNKVLKYLIFVSIVGGLQIFGIILGEYVQRIDLEEAKNFCEKIVTIDPTERQKFIENNPIRLQKKIQYKGNKDNFRCLFYDPREIFTIWLHYHYSKWAVN